MIEENKNFDVVVKIIPHAQQRYNTVGDWFLNEDGTLLTIHVSDMNDWRYAHLIAFHEYAEFLWCKKAGITQRMVDTFDMRYEEERETKLDDVLISPQEKVLINLNEPGDDVQAPYKHQHCAATGFERLLAAGLGVNWSEYEKAVNSL